MKLRKLLPLLLLSTLSACSFTFGDFDGSFDPENGSEISITEEVLEVVEDSLIVSAMKLFTGYSVDGSYDVSYTVPVDEDTSLSLIDASFNFTREMGDVSKLEDLRNLTSALRISDIGLNLNGALFDQENPGDRIVLPVEYEAGVTIGTKAGYGFVDLSNNVINNVLENYFYSKATEGMGQLDEDTQNYVHGQVVSMLDASIGNKRKCYLPIENFISYSINIQRIMSDIVDTISSAMQNISESGLLKFVTAKQFGENLYGFQLNLPQKMFFGLLLKLLKKLNVNRAEPDSLSYNVYQFVSSAADTDLPNVFPYFDFVADMRLGANTGVRSLDISLNLELPKNKGYISLNRTLEIDYRSPVISDDFDLEEYSPYTEWIDETTLPSYYIVEIDEVETKQINVNVGEPLKINVRTLPLNLYSSAIEYSLVSGESTSTCNGSFDGTFYAAGEDPIELTITFGQETYEYLIHVLELQSEDTQE